MAGWVSIGSTEKINPITITESGEKDFISLIKPYL